jgi:hypothetical protein
MADASPEHAWPVQATLAVRLVAETERKHLHAVSSRTFRVIVDGYPVGDGCERCGSHYRCRRRWATWGQEGASTARWSTDLEHRTRTAARTALLARVKQSGSVQR